MSETVPVAPAEVKHDGFLVSSNTESAKQIKDNLGPEEKDKGGEEPAKTPKDRRREAASELGKAGGKAAAKARQEREEPEPEKEPEPKEAAGEEPKETPTTSEKESEGEESPRHSARARVMEATRKLAEERQKREAAERRLAELQTAPPSAEKLPVERPASLVQGPPRMEVEKHETYEAGIEDFVNRAVPYQIERRLQELIKKSEIEARIQKEVTEKESIVLAFRDRLMQAAKDDPELFVRGEDGKLTSNKIHPDLMHAKPTFLLRPDQQLSNGEIAPGERAMPVNDLMEAVYTWETGPKLLQYLSSHPDELEDLLQSKTTYRLMAALGRIEDKITSGKHSKAEGSEEEEEERPVSQARPPVRPVPSSAQAGQEEDDEKLSLTEYIRKQNAKEERLRKAGR
jgi:hypothetical protein